MTTSTRARAKKPTALKRMQGNPGGHELIDSPNAPIGLPKPKTLTKYEEEMWDYLSVRLINMGTVTELDTFAMYMLCQMWGQYRSACEELERQTDSIGLAALAGPNKVNPIVKVINDCYDRIQKMLVQFGMTPLSRNNIASVKKDEENPWEEFD